MRTSFLSISFRLAAALTLSMAGMAQAADTGQPSATHAEQRDSRQNARNETAHRVAWNIDYPSQLGPEGPQLSAHVQNAPGDGLARQQPASR